MISISPPDNNPLLNLPVNILEIILLKLDPRSLLNFSESCKFAQSISFSNILWFEMQDKYFNLSMIDDSKLLPLPHDSGEHYYDYFCRRIEVRDNWFKKKFSSHTIETKFPVQYIDVISDYPDSLFGICKNNIVEWDLVTKEQKSSYCASAKSTNHFCIDTTRLFISDFEGVRVVDRHTKQLLYNIEGLLSQAHHLKVYGDLLLLGMWDGYIQIHDIPSGGQCSRLVGHNYRVNCLDMSGNIVASASSDKTVKLWNYPTSGLLGTLRGHSKMVNVVQIASHQQSVLSASKDGTIRLWKPHLGYSTAPRILTTNSPINTMQYDGEHKIISGGDDKLIRIWDIRLNDTDANVISLEGHTGPVNTIHFDEYRILSGGSDKTIHLWDYRV